VLIDYFVSCEINTWQNISLLALIDVVLKGLKETLKKVRNTWEVMIDLSCKNKFPGCQLLSRYPYVETGILYLSLN
jgi:hypothetical protein